MSTEQVRDGLPDEVAALAAYARLLTGNEHDAADLLQDTLERALARGASFDGRSSLRTWLRRIMHNRWVDTVRGHREEPREDITDAVEANWKDDNYTVDASLVVERAETRDDLLDALAHMPAIYREAVVLHDAHGMPASEVAEVAGVSLPAAKQRIRRGRMILVSQLARASSAPTRPPVPLRCWQARSRVSDYLDGDLDAATARALETHLAGCGTCPPLYSALVGTRTALADAATADPDTVVPEELAARIAALGAQPSKRRRSVVVADHHSSGSSASAIARPIPNVPSTSDSTAPPTDRS